MNKKGSTVIELMVTFCLITTISILLIQLSLTLKEIYLEGDIKTTLLVRQGTMLKKINGDLNKKTLTSITSCGDSCLSFVYSDSTKKLIIDKTNKIITYDNYSIKLDNNSKIGVLSASKNVVGTETINTIFKIEIPITNKLIEGDLGINIIYQSNSSIIDNSVSVFN